MTQVVIYTNPEEPYNVCVVDPIGEQEVSELIKAVPAGAEYRVVDRQSLPPQAGLFNAWRLGAQGVSVDKAAAEAIVADKRDRKLLPKLRDAKLEELARGQNRTAEIAQLNAELSVSLSSKSVDELEQLLNSYK